MQKLHQSVEIFYNQKQFALGIYQTTSKNNKLHSSQIRFGTSTQILETILAIKGTEQGQLIIKNLFALKIKSSKKVLRKKKQETGRKCTKLLRNRKFIFENHRNVQVVLGLKAPDNLLKVSENSFALKTHTITHLASITTETSKATNVAHRFFISF